VTILAPAATGAADEIAEAPGQIAPDQTVATIAAPASAQAELDAAHTRIGDLERELVATREQLDERRSKIAELEDKFATAQLAAETAIAALRGVIEARP
jgi:chromosome segregation ATPase